MKCYLTANAAPVERSLRRHLSGSARRLETWGRFPNGERRLRLQRPGKNVCVAGRIGPDGSGSFEIQLLIDTLQRAGAEHITVCLPYLAYARQDKPRDRFDAFPPAVIMRALAAAGASRIIAADAHSPVSAAASPVPMESVSIMPALASVLRSALPAGPVTIVAPDAGSRERAAKTAEYLGRGSVVWIDKERTGPRSVRSLGLRGRLEGETAVIVDDMCDTASTVEVAAGVLRKRGMKRLYLAVTHPLFSGKAAQRLQSIRFERIVVSDTMPLSRETGRLGGLKIVPAAPLLAEVVKG